MSFDEPRVLTLLLAAAPLGLWSAFRSRRRLGSFLDLAGRRDGGALERELAFRGTLAGALFLAALCPSADRAVPLLRSGAVQVW